MDGELTAPEQGLRRLIVGVKGGPPVGMFIGETGDMVSKSNSSEMFSLTIDGEIEGSSFCDWDAADRSSMAWSTATGQEISVLR